MYVIRERERNVLFNDALNTFYLRLYGIRHMVKDHSDSETYHICVFMHMKDFLLLTNMKLRQHVSSVVI